MNLRVSKLKASTKSKSQQAAAVGVACTFERYAVWSWGTCYTAHGGYVAPAAAPAPRPWRCGRSPVWLGPAACAARWAVHGPRGRGRGGAGARRARGEP